MTDREAINKLHQMQMQIWEVRHFDLMFESVEVAKEALKERIDREDTCEFCSRLEYDYVLVPYNEIEILGSGSGEKKYRKVKINRCPKCGHKLKP